MRCVHEKYVMNMRGKLATTDDKKKYKLISTIYLNLCEWCFKFNYFFSCVWQ